MINTILGKLVAKQDDVYKNYVFQNLDQADNSLFKYTTVTICPNWQYNENIKIGDIGFVEYDLVEAGEEYFKRDCGETRQYNFSTYYFINFIPKKEEINKELNF